MQDLAEATRDVLIRAAGAPAPPPASFQAPRDLARHIDATLLRPETTEWDVRRLCDEAVRYEFLTVCVSPVYVPLAVPILSGTRTRVGTVAGFPAGTAATPVKVFEVRHAVDAGATEVDVALHVGALKGGDHDRVSFELGALAAVARATGIVLKVILETPLLTDEEKAMGALLARDAGVDFVKTCTGFGPRGASLQDVRILRAAVGEEIGVKAAGGIRNRQQALAFLEAGATRIGTSHGAALLEEMPAERSEGT